MVCKIDLVLPQPKPPSFNPCYVGLWSVRFLPFSGRFGNRCFNPCYVGLWSVSRHLTRSSLAFNTFQSLLCWIMVCKIYGEKHFRQAITFQSLLCWIMVCKWGFFCLGRRFITFQSLLCWIMVCKVDIGLPQTILVSFNPCYVGLWSVSMEHSLGSG